MRVSSHNWRAWVSTTDARELTQLARVRSRAPDARYFYEIIKSRAPDARQTRATSTGLFDRYTAIRTGVRLATRLVICPLLKAKHKMRVWANQWNGFDWITRNKIIFNICCVYFVPSRPIHWSSWVVSLNWTIIFTSWWFPLIWALTMPSHACGHTTRIVSDDLVATALFLITYNSCSLLK